jgi:hypothetical protein
MGGKVTTERIASVRAFNRFYTDLLGILREGLLRTPYSLTEARVLFEIAQQETTEVAELLADASERILFAEHLEGEGAQIQERAGAMGVIVETPASPPNL